MGGRLALGARILGAAGRIAADRLDEARGRALPRTPEQLARPATLDALLREGAPPGAPPLPRLRAARLPGVVFESSNCRNFVVELAFEDAAEVALPPRVYAKLPGERLATRAFAHLTGFWRAEVAFCRRVAPLVPVRVPRVHAAVSRGARFALLLEDLRELPGARLFTNRDMAAGTTPERARACLETFAALHARFWALLPPERESLLPGRLHPYLGAGAAARGRALLAAAIGPTRRAAPELFTARHAELCRRAARKWDALLDAWYAGPLPLTLCHGDSHLANCFEYAAPDGPRVGLLDFQGVQWCPGIRDVQYFLADSLDPPLLAECEDEMLRAYADALAKAGVALDADAARAGCRAFALQTLAVAVVSCGLGSMTERDETLRTVLARSVAAVDRLEVADWLAAL